MPSHATFPPSIAEDSSLPDFCQFRVLLSVMALAQLVALLLAVVPISPHPFDWGRLVLVTVFTQGLVLLSAGLLCLLRPILRVLRPAWAIALAFSILPTLTVLLSYLAYGTPSILALGPQVHEQLGEFVLRNTAISAFISVAMLRYAHAQYRWRKNLEIQARAQYQALQAKIRPHFLFNSLNTIASLIGSRPEQAEAAVEDLADLFRATLSERLWVSLEEELDITRRYLRLEELRLGPRLQIRWRIADIPTDAVIPTLILQPLVENAIYHGIQPLPEGGSLIIDGHFEADRITLAVHNPVQPNRAYGSHKGNRMAQDNIRQRLAIAYADQARFVICTEPDSYDVYLTLPYRRHAP